MKTIRVTVTRKKVKTKKRRKRSPRKNRREEAGNEAGRAISSRKRERRLL